MLALRTATTLAACLVLLPSCVGDDAGDPDAAVYDIPDAGPGPKPEFRDGGCGGGGTSGTSGQGGASGTGCRDSGVISVPDASPPDATPCDLHTFTYVDASATTVWVTGDFTSWADSPGTGALVMTDAGGGTWTVTSQIGPGSHSYKLIVDGASWIADPNNPNTEPDGFGGVNSVIEVCGSSIN